MSDIRLNRTEIDSHWVVSRQDFKQRKTVNYKSDGMLFKEDRDAHFIAKKLKARAHSHDEYIQNHNKVSNTYSVPPYYDNFSDLDDELTASYSIVFNEDGTAVATFNTKQRVKDWEVRKKYKPVHLRREPK